MVAQIHFLSVCSLINEETEKAGLNCKSYTTSNRIIAELMFGFSFFFVVRE